MLFIITRAIFSVVKLGKTSIKFLSYMTEKIWKFSIDWLWLLAFQYLLFLHNPHNLALGTGGSIDIMMQSLALKLYVIMLSD